MMRRTHEAEEQRILRPFIGSENILPKNFFQAVEPRDALAAGHISEATELLGFP